MNSWIEANTASDYYSTAYKGVVAMNGPRIRIPSHAARLLVACAALSSAHHALATETDRRDQDVDRETIVVTGERVEASLQETASSVAVFDPEAIERTSADRLDQLLESIPNVQVGSGETGPSIRGLDSTGVLRGLFAFAGGARPRVTVQVDGRPVSFYEFVSGVQGMWDVDRVEVFRSPQTTTQGLNSIAGAIFVETGKPASEWAGLARISAGSLKTRNLSGVVTGPILKSQLLVRASGDLRAMRTSSRMADGIPNASLDRDDYGVARLKTLYLPDWLPGLALTTTYTHVESQAPQFEGVTKPFERRVVDLPDRTNGVMRVNSDSLSVQGKYESGSGTAATLSISGGDVTLERFGLPGLGQARADLGDRTVELVVTRQTGPLSLLGGINSRRTEQDQALDITGLRYGAGQFFDRQRSTGLFAQVLWHPVPALSLSAGARYENTGQKRTGSVGRIDFDYDETFAAFLPKASVAYDFAPGLTAGILVQRAFNPGGTSISLFRGAEDRFDAEYLWNYEFFSRGESGSGRWRYSFNLFYNDIQDAQRQMVLPIIAQNGATLFVTEFVNTPKAWVKGMELDVRGKLNPRMSLYAGLGLLRTRVVRTSIGTDPAQGREFERAPNTTLVLGIDWQPVARLNLSGQGRYHSGYFSNGMNTPALVIPRNFVVDIRASWAGKRVEPFAYARNLFNKFYLTYLYSPTYGSAADPREAGVGLNARF